MKQYTNLFQREPDFAEIKFAVANIQFNNLSLSKDGSAIEANPATHRIAEYIVGLLKQKLEEKGTTVSNKEVVLEENTIRKAMFDAWVAALERMEYMRGGGPISFNPPPDKFEFIDPYIQKHFPSPSSTVKEEVLKKWFSTKHPIIERLRKQCGFSTDEVLEIIDLVLKDKDLSSIQVPSPEERISRGENFEPNVQY